MGGTRRLHSGRNAGLRVKAGRSSAIPFSMSAASQYYRTRGAGKVLKWKDRFKQYLTDRAREARASHHHLARTAHPRERTTEQLPHLEDYWNDFMELQDIEESEDDLTRDEVLDLLLQIEDEIQTERLDEEERALRLYEENEAFEMAELEALLKTWSL